MSDELDTMEAPDEGAVEKPEPEAPDPLEAKEKALAEREAKLEARAAELQRLSSDLGRQRAAETQAAPKTEEFEFTAEQERMFAAYLKKTVGVDPEELAAATRLTQESMAARMNSVANDFHAKNKDITPDKVVDVLSEFGIDVEALRTPEQLEAALKLAKGVLDSKEADKHIAAEVEKRLAELAPKDGEEIVELKPKKGAPLEGKRSIQEAIDDPNLTFAQRMELASQLPYE